MSLRSLKGFREIQGVSNYFGVSIGLQGFSEITRVLEAGFFVFFNNIHYTVLFLIWIILYTECFVNSVPAVCHPLQSPFLWKISKFSRVHTTH